MARLPSFRLGASDTSDRTHTTRQYSNSRTASEDVRTRHAPRECHRPHAAVLVLAVLVEVDGAWPCGVALCSRKKGSKEKKKKENRLSWQPTCLRKQSSIRVQLCKQSRWRSTRHLSWRDDLEVLASSCQQQKTMHRCPWFAFGVPLFTHLFVVGPRSTMPLGKSVSLLFSFLFPFPLLNALV